MSASGNTMMPAMVALTVINLIVLGLNHVDTIPS
jgi:hypothetical protein